LRAFERSLHTTTTALHFSEDKVALIFRYGDTTRESVRITAKRKATRTGGMVVHMYHTVCMMYVGEARRLLTFLTRKKEKALVFLYSLVPLWLELTRNTTLYSYVVSILCVVLVVPPP
jgi:hypothetical protein